LSYRKHDENEFWNCSPVPRTVTNSPANLTIIGGTTAVALLVLTTIHNSRWAVAYLSVFGIAHPQWVPAPDFPPDLVCIASEFVIKFRGQSRDSRNKRNFS
ncbi:MAG TPA: hypothetical protein VGI34_04635, partial [Candidatus Acidoferrales bacterium]